MANRSMLFAVTSLPTQGKRPDKILALGEFGWDIPIIFQLLVSAAPRACPSIVWEHEELIAIAGDLPGGLERLKSIRAGIADDAPSAADIDEAIDYLGKPHLSEYSHFLIEPGEIFDLSSDPFSEQTDALLGEINALDTEALIQIANTRCEPTDWGPGCWSDILYYQPEGSVKPPLDPASTYIIADISYVLENAETWASCTELDSVTLSGVGNPQQLSEALHCLKAVPSPFELWLSGQIGELPENICDITQLTGLTIGQLGLNKLPRNLPSLKNLERVSVQCNALTEFPDELRMLPKLRILSIWQHPFGAIPDWIGELSALEEVLIGQCNLSALPDSLWDLKNLRRLDVSENPGLTELPNAIGQLGKLEELKVYGCSLRTLPNALASLPNLQNVYAGNNQIKSLPRNLWRKKLDVLSIADNPGLRKPMFGCKAKSVFI